MLLSVGRLAREKRHELAIDAVRRSRHRDRIQLVILGDGPLREELEEKGRDLPNPPVFNFLKKDELIHWYGAGDLCVHASEVEVECMSVLEAQACGLPCLIANSARSATPQFALSADYLFDSGNVDDLTQEARLAHRPARAASCRPRGVPAGRGRLRIEASLEKLLAVYRTAHDGLTNWFSLQPSASDLRLTCVDRHRHFLTRSPCNLVVLPAPSRCCSALPPLLLMPRPLLPRLRPGATAVAASDTTATARIIREIASNQRAMTDLAYLTYIVGPRLTGSDRLLRAHAWAESTLVARGAANVHREAYAFGRSWTRGPATARFLTQNGDAITLAALGWSKPTPGPVKGDVLVVSGKTVAELEKYIGQFKGRIVTFGEMPPWGADSLEYQARCGSASRSPFAMRARWPSSPLPGRRRDSP